MKQNSLPLLEIVDDAEDILKRTKVVALNHLGYEVSFLKMIYTETSPNEWKKRLKMTTKQESVKYKEILGLESEIESLISLASSAKSNSVQERYAHIIETLMSRSQKLQEVKVHTLSNDEFACALSKAKLFLRTPQKYWLEAYPQSKSKINSLIFQENPRYNSLKGFRTPQLRLLFKLCSTSSTQKSNLVEMAEKVSNHYVLVEIF